MSILSKIPAYIGALTLSGAAIAHEYWIEPDTYRLESGANIVAHVKVGSDFKGDSYAYFPHYFTRFNITDPAETHPIAGRIGDTPAIDIETTVDGLHVLSQLSTANKITWSDFNEFESFALSHGMDWVLRAHADRGLPNTGFGEGYTRFVKSLLAVGDGAGADTFGGMFFELVAAANPYVDDISGGLPVTVLFEGEPLANTQIHVFYRADPAENAIKSSVVAGDTGIAIIPNLGGGEYMINAVHMIVPSAQDQERTGTVWHSLWASLTYQIDE